MVAIRPATLVRDAQRGAGLAARLLGRLHGPAKTAFLVAAMGVRIQRMQEFLKQEIGQILHQEVSDPRLQFVSVTRVDVSADLRFAKVYVSALQSDTRLHTIMEALGKATGHVQSLVAPRLSTRFSPKIHFFFDPGIKRSVEVSKLISEAIAEDEARADEESPAPPKAPQFDVHAADVDAGLA